MVDGVAGKAELDVVYATFDRGVLGLLALVQKHRDGDRRQDTDNDDDDEELDEREAPLARAPSHGFAFLSSIVASASTLA